MVLPAYRTIASPQAVRTAFTRLSALRQQAESDAAKVGAELDSNRRYLAVAERVTAALETLSQQLFREVLDVVEEKLTIALQEILEQPIQLRAKVDWLRGAAAVDFWIERDSNREDIMKGQGGSVANILSVGLRMFALATLDEKSHRRFLVLDEQDCWLRPDLVPRLVKIVHDAGKALGFQVLMISHHDAESFRKYADRVYRLVPRGEAGIEVELLQGESDSPNLDS